jgi:hypothetical protein
MVKRSTKIINDKNLNPKGVINDLNGEVIQLQKTFM